MFESWCEKSDIYGFEIHDFVEFGAHPGNIPDLVEENNKHMKIVLPGWR